MEGGTRIQYGRGSMLIRGNKGHTSGRGPAEGGARRKECCQGSSGGGWEVGWQCGHNNHEPHFTS